jgi:magnesium transporter
VPEANLPAQPHHHSARLRPVALPPSHAPVYTVFDYDAASLDERQMPDEASCKTFSQNGRISWINVDGLAADEVERLCTHYDVHPLIVEDIMSLNERPKMEEAGSVIFSVLPMMFFDKTSGLLEMEQVSIILGKDFVLSFQEEASRDVFDPIRRHLRNPASKLRHRNADYLMYSLLDVIVDGYFEVLEQLADRLEALEETLIRRQTVRELTRISGMRRDMSTIRRALLPVRELVAHFVRSDSDLLDERNQKYYRDILDHTIQATDFMENHRDMLMNLQDLYMNQINLRMNEVMKVFTMVATLLAPATVIGGIFGMNFDVIPLSHQARGFWIAVAAMLIIPVGMMFWFKRRGWF